MCFMMHEILEYENKNILMEKMGKQYLYSQTPTMFRKKLYRGLGRGGFKFVTVT